MRSLFEHKRLVLVFAVLALGALTALAISLSEVPFREGQHFVREQVEQAPVPPSLVAPVFVDIPLWQQLLALIVLALLIVLIALLLSPEMRKRMFLLLIRGVLTALGIYYVLKNYRDQIIPFNLQGAAESVAGDATAVPMPVFQPPSVSPAFSYLISFAFALIVLTVGWIVYRHWQTRYGVLGRSKPLDEIARIARSSLHDLSSDRNSSDVIINCYLRMSDAVSSKRQLQREVAMTPHEFAVRLERAGLPGDAVNRLTRLFEGVRYGDRRSNPKDVNEAVSCLKTILQYCGEAI
jgi:hypothetical protein